MSEAADESQPTHYQILQLKQKGGRIDHVELKMAYRQALLLHHPDKNSPTSSISKSVGQTSNQAYSVDQITRAFKTLSSTVAKTEYDKSLEWDTGRLNTGPKMNCPAGVETYDLDELCYDNTADIWSRKCRCGDDRAYTLTESDLEKESEYGEIYIACQGCTLSIRVLFDTAEACTGREDVC
jgi:DnaJ-class molecular chaperone